MKEDLINEEKSINNLFNNIKGMVIDCRNRVYSTVNTEMLNLYWNIGKSIMEIQQGDERASYGDLVLEKLSQKLTNEFGKGFSIINLRRMRKFYCMFPICSTLLTELSWSHYLELIRIDEEPKRKFYMHECINSNWSVREFRMTSGIDILGKKVEKRKSKPSNTPAISVVGVFFRKLCQSIFLPIYLQFEIGINTLIILCAFMINYKKYSIIIKLILDYLKMKIKKIFEKK